MRELSVPELGLLAGDLVAVTVEVVVLLHRRRVLLVVVQQARDRFARGVVNGVLAPHAVRELLVEVGAVVEDPPRSRAPERRRAGRGAGMWLGALGGSRRGHDTNGSSPLAEPKTLGGGAGGYVAPGHLSIGRAGVACPQLSSVGAWSWASVLAGLAVFLWEATSPAGRGPASPVMSLLWDWLEALALPVAVGSACRCCSTSMASPTALDDTFGYGLPSAGLAGFAVLLSSPVTWCHGTWTGFTGNTLWDWLEPGAAARSYSRPLRSGSAPDRAGAGPG